MTGHGGASFWSTAPQMPQSSSFRTYDYPSYQKSYRPSQFSRVSAAVFAQALRDPNGSPETALSEDSPTQVSSNTAHSVSTPPSSVATPKNGERERSLASRLAANSIGSSSLSGLSSGSVSAGSVMSDATVVGAPRSRNESNATYRPSHLVQEPALRRVSVYLGDGSSRDHRQSFIEHSGPSIKSKPRSMTSALGTPSSLAMLRSGPSVFPPDSRSSSDSPSRDESPARGGGVNLYGHGLHAQPRTTRDDPVQTEVVTQVVVERDASGLQQYHHHYHYHHYHHIVPAQETNSQISIGTEPELGRAIAVPLHAVKSPEGRQTPSTSSDGDLFFDVLSDGEHDTPDYNENMEASGVRLDAPVVAIVPTSAHLEGQDRKIEGPITNTTQPNIARKVRRYSDSLARAVPRVRQLVHPRRTFSQSSSNGELPKHELSKREEEKQKPVLAKVKPPKSRTFTIRQVEQRPGGRAAPHREADPLVRLGVDAEMNGEISGSITSEDNRGARVRSWPHRMLSALHALRQDREGKAPKEQNPKSEKIERGKSVRQSEATESTDSGVRISKPEKVKENGVKLWPFTRSPSMSAHVFSESLGNDREAGDLGGGLAGSNKHQAAVKRKPNRENSTKGGLSSLNNHSSTETSRQSQPGVRLWKNQHPERRSSIAATSAISNYHPSQAPTFAPISESNLGPTDKGIQGGVRRSRYAAPREKDRRATNSFEYSDKRGGWDPRQHMAPAVAPSAVPAPAPAPVATSQHGLVQSVEAPTHPPAGPAPARSTKQKSTAKRSENDDADSGFSSDSTARPPAAQAAPAPPPRADELESSRSAPFAPPPPPPAPAPAPGPAPAHALSRSNSLARGSHPPRAIVTRGFADGDEADGVALDFGVDDYGGYEFDYGENSHPHPHHLQQLYQHHQMDPSFEAEYARYQYMRGPVEPGHGAGGGNMDSSGVWGGPFSMRGSGGVGLSPDPFFRDDLGGMPADFGYGGFELGAFGGSGGLDDGFGIQRVDTVTSTESNGL